MIMKGKNKRLKSTEVLMICLVVTLCSFIIPFHFTIWNVDYDLEDDIQFNLNVSSLSSEDGGMFVQNRFAPTETQKAISHDIASYAIQSETTRRHRGYSTDKMTAVITTFKQPICLERMIILLKSCPIVEEIRVNWFEETDPMLTHSSHKVDDDVPVIFDKYPDKLSYRFHPRDFRTDAIFSVDVDMFYDCDSLQMAFDTWKTSNSQTNNSDKDYNSTTVGFHGRFIRKVGDYDFSVSYKLRTEFKHNTVFVTKGGITHKNAFNEFFKDEYKDLRDYVDEKITAEDILMSFILDKMKSKIVFTCAEAHSICHVNCNQNKIGSLNLRSNSNRVNMTLAFWDYFGLDNAFKTIMTGVDNIVWQGGPMKHECEALNREEYGNVPHCEEFCSRNLICPSHVKGKTKKKKRKLNGNQT